MATRYWLFYAGPENYLAGGGVRGFAGTLVTWSCSPEVRPGDLALLYRRGLAKTSVADIQRLTGVSVELARLIKRDVGSEISDVFRITSGNRGPQGGWSSTCDVTHLASINPPLKLAELREDFRLLKWEDLRWNFQSKGREALEIPHFAWLIISAMISKRVGGFETLVTG